MFIQIRYIVLFSREMQVVSQKCSLNDYPFIISNLNLPFLNHTHLATSGPQTDPGNPLVLGTGFSFVYDFYQRKIVTNVEQ